MLLQVLFFILRLILTTTYIKNVSEKNKINNNEANNKAASYIINLKDRSISLWARFASCISCTYPWSASDGKSESIRRAKPVSLFSKLKRSIILLDSMSVETQVSNFES